MNAKTVIPTIPPALAKVALIDAPTCAATGGMSVSWWHEEVRTGRAPAPVVRQPRCTRWRVADVAAYWQAFATKGEVDTEAAEQVTAKAMKASAAAQAKRGGEGNRKAPARGRRAAGAHGVAA